MLKGLTLPNVAFRPYSTAELSALDDLKPSCLVFLLYGGAIDQQHAAQLAPYLHAHNPRILFRPYAGNILTWEPNTWAKECDKRIRVVSLAGECIPSNEQNLLLEGGSEDWARHVTWFTALVQAWRAISTEKVHLPALSPVGKWVDGILAYRAANIDLLFDRIDVHCYGPDAATVAMVVTSTLRGKSDITEFNQIEPSLLFSQVEKGVESATWFLLGGTEDQASNDILKQPDAYQSFKSWGEETMPTNFISGIDVSNHQGTIDWALTARCGISFAVIKASEGPDATKAEYPDQFFTANWKAAKDHGLVRGAYFFGRPSHSSGHNDAKLFLAHLTDLQVGDFLALDLEDDRVSSHADLLAYVVDFMATVKAAVGFNPLLYSSHSYLSAHNCEGKAELKDNGIWLASWQLTIPPTPNGWDFLAMWQWNDKGTLPGVKTVVDLDFFNGTVDQLRRYGKIA